MNGMDLLGYQAGKVRAILKTRQCIQEWTE